MGKLSVDAKLRYDLNCEFALITAVSVVTILLRRTRGSAFSVIPPKRGTPFSDSITLA